MIPVVPHFAVSEQLAGPDQISQLVDGRLGILPLAAVEISVKDAACMRLMSAIQMEYQAVDWITHG